MRTASRKLDQLTSLRFFAAMMIVLHHAPGYFGIQAMPFNLGQGVSFFFVLSGFILTYVYPKLARPADIRRFWRARVARVWPAHVAALALGAVLVGYPAWDPYTLAANLAMLQSWLPVSKYYFSYNSVSWSISTEFFFYLAFPWLIARWERTWWRKLLLVLVVLAVLVAFCNLAGLPAYGDPALPDQGLWVTQHGLAYIHPAARLFEFVTGMCIALLWQRTQDRALGAGAGTALEVVALLACIASVAYSNELANMAYGTVLGAAGQLWLSHAGSMFAFGLLIYVTALGRGWLSRALALPWLVVLGEISYSLYLVHQLLLRYYTRHLEDFAGLPDVVAGGLFLAALLLVSYLMWTLVEMPGRRLLLGSGGTDVHGTGVFAQSWSHRLQMHRRALVAGVALVAVTMLARLDWPASMQPATATVAAAATAEAAPPAAAVVRPTTFPDVVGARFGEDATLHKLELRCGIHAIELRSTWSSPNGRAGAMMNAVHAVDEAGAILDQFDYPQPVPTADVRAGGAWVDKVRVPYARLFDADADHLTLGLYDKAQGLRTIDRGPRDWNGRRLVIDLPACAREKLGMSTPAAATAGDDA
jgi:peptidoglycan/LPS O-acetylase OafA/YrhL